MGRWSAADIPDLTGRAAVVTGANSGLGWQTALELARHGAAVTMACRDEAKGTAALDRLRAEVPAADAVVRLLDLADLASVRAFAETVVRDGEPVDMLVNNAGVMATPYLPCHCTWRLGENIARGQGRRASPAAIVRAWMHSPPHRAEILSPSLRDVGVGVVWGSKRNRRANVGTFTADFGSKRH